MERERIAALLDKYWQAETSVEEEKILTEFFRGPDVPPDWDAYREIFSFFELETQVKPGAGLEEKIMRHVKPRPFPIAWWAAAAVIILVWGTVSLLQPEKTSIQPKSLVMKDTYDDPQQALAVIQKALFTASVKMNKGLRPLK